MHALSSDAAASLDPSAASGGSTAPPMAMTLTRTAFFTSSGTPPVEACSERHQSSQYMHYGDPRLCQRCSRPSYVHNERHYLLKRPVMHAISRRHVINAT
jgi:hypothetical protein